MELPGDFSTKLAKLESYGILDENSDQIEARLLDAIRGAGAEAEAGAIDLGPVRDWAFSTWQNIKRAVYNEICDPPQGLKKVYEDRFDGALTPASVSAVATSLTTIVSAINPAFVVSTVIVLLAAWILKAGAAEWCRNPLS